MDDRPQPDSSRREGIESAPVKLADGNLWGLATPRARLRPRVIPGVDTLGRPIETIRVDTEFGYPLEIRRLIDDLRLACEPGMAERQHQALFRLAASLIRRAHELSSEEVAGLLEMDLEDLPGFVEVVLSVVTGAWPETDDLTRKSDAHV